mmetsp:Transcript_39661/g.132219  ORF Transcript_39661/g.132219 Transcript_39661/m.132219 type:complete len:351 (+) Transcript_39661:25-1077(+)
MAASGLPVAILWSSIACFLFGVQNYAIAYTNSLPGDDFCRTVGLLWFFTGVCGLGALARHPLHRIFFSEAEAKPGLAESLIAPEAGPVTLLSKTATLGGGLAIGMAQLFMKLSFGADPDAEGPLASVICADVILVSVLCHFVYHEYLNAAQWGSVALVFAGLITMAGVFDGGGGTSVSPVAFSLAFAAMISFGASIFSVRVAAVGGIAASSGFIARTLILGAFSVPLLIAARWDSSSVLGVLIPSSCGFMQAAGVYSINEALSVGPYTSISIAIFGSNSLVVLLLAAIVEGHVPALSALVGMALTASGCVIISLAAPPEAPPEEEGLEEMSSSLPRKGGNRYSTGGFGAA